jgi:hypothetical protein
VSAVEVAVAELRCGGSLECAVFKLTTAFLDRLAHGSLVITSKAKSFE